MAAVIEISVSVRRLKFETGCLKLATLGAALPNRPPAFIQHLHSEMIFPSLIEFPIASESYAETVPESYNC